jgi:sorbitol/mannitol transport system permease protein
MRRLLSIIIVLLFVLPFASVLVLSVSVVPTRASFRLSPGWSTALQNLNAVIGRDQVQPSHFLGAFATSFEISALCALAAVSIAIFAGRGLVTVLPSAASAMVGAFVGTRLIPITAALPAFLWLVGFLRDSGGIGTVGIIYFILFFPLACALMASANWRLVDRSVSILEFDGYFSRTEDLAFRLRQLRGDVFVAAGAVFLLCWSEFFLAVSVLAPGQATLATYLSSFETMNGYSWGPLSMSLVICVLPIIALGGVLLFNFQNNIQRDHNDA